VAIVGVELGVPTAQLSFQSQIVLVLLTHRGFPTGFKTRGESKFKKISKEGFSIHGSFKSHDLR